MLEPIFALVAWSLVAWVWMYIVRMPAMNKAGMAPDDARHVVALDKLPSKVRAVGDNYNHLHEQPTVFYALALATHLAGLADGLAIALAWAYVALRVLHSIVQNTFNRVLVRFAVFALSTLALMALTLKNLLALYA